MKDTILQHFGTDWPPFFEGYLGPLKKAGDQYTARCCFHEDSNPSLSINPTTGKWYCHACKVGGDAFTLVEKISNLSFPEVLNAISSKFGITGNGNGSRPNSSARRKLIKRYTYQGADGTDLFYKNRYEPKGFSICRPNGPDSYLNGMGGVKPVLYRLPEVMAADEVWVVEGEKDADALAELGIIATTNFDGAGKWSDSYTDALRDKQIVLVPDADDPGRAHVQKVAAALVGNAKSIKILELPNPSNKKGYDTSDFITEQPDRKTAVDRLVLMLERAPDYQPGQLKPEKPRFEFIHSAKIMADLKPIQWRIDGVLVDESFYIDFGESGHYKTFVAIDRLMSVAAGIDYHGRQVKQGPVFYIAGEGQQGIGRRIKAWHCLHGTLQKDVPFFVARVATQLMNPGALDDVKRAVDTMAVTYGYPAMIHIDTLARNFGDGDENSTKDMNLVIQNLDASFSGICHGLSHHTGHKDKERARGSYALHAAVDTSYRVSLTSTDQVLVECKKMKDAPITPPMLFNRLAVILKIGDTEDRTYGLQLAAEGDGVASVPKSNGGGGLKGNLYKALAVLRRLHKKYAKRLAQNGRPGALPQVSYAEWRDACIDMGMYSRTDSFGKAAAKLKDQGCIEYDESGIYVYPVESTTDNDES